MQRFLLDLLICIILACPGCIFGNNNPRIDLSGDWHYSLLGAPSEIPGEGIIELPNTLDNAHKSVYNRPGDETSQLRREFSFAGEASYSRQVNIPSNWKDKEIFLVMERSRPTSIKIDGNFLGSDSRISSPQVYSLGSGLSPGRHTLEIIVNNADSIPPIVARSSNAVSEATQTNWNGILGDFYLEARDKFSIDNIRVEELPSGEFANLQVTLSSPAPRDFKIALPWKNNTLISEKIAKGDSLVVISLPLEKQDLWSHYNPVLHPLEFRLTDSKGNLVDSFNFTTGFRNFKASGNSFYINDLPVFLRGTVNAAVFPLTAHPPFDVEKWMEYFRIVKDYGLNHVRFHSWTPPEAAFEAADQLGIYLLVELPIWGELDRDLKFHNRFLKEELTGIMEAYAHHPSFVMFSPGNELWGDISLMGEYMEAAKELNHRILATYGSNVYLGMNGEIGGEDFVLSAKTEEDIESAVRGSMSFADSPSGGVINSTFPSSDFNFSGATLGVSVPLVSHEVGQYQIYPDFSQIEKYKGVLKPDNLEEFKKRAVEAGTFLKNSAYAEASGKWAAKLYKAEMEAAYRTPGIAGFELFGLQDYPGQGTALVGILDSFMDSKGVVTPQEWRQSASDVMALAEFPKFTFSEYESVEIPVEYVNYSPDPEALGTIEWSTGFDSGKIYPSKLNGRNIAGSINLVMPRVKIPRKFSLVLKDSQGKTLNNYDFWVYPSSLPEVKNVKLTSNLYQALNWLNKGERVILCPDSVTLNSDSVTSAALQPLFVNDFWNYRMFRTICDEMHLTPSPGTLGMLIENSHPALKYFPTDSHTDWQWFAIVANSRPLIIDRLPKDFSPIVEVIDNVERNFRLALMLECNVGKGKLMIISVDLEKAEQYPEGRWLLQSVKEYMASKECKPSVTLTPEQLINLLTKPSTARLIKELKNETYNSHW